LLATCNPVTAGFLFISSRLPLTLDLLSLLGCLLLQEKNTTGGRHTAVGENALNATGSSNTAAR